MPESEATTHNYLFCQFIYPESGHDGGPCDCYHTPSQKRIARAEARLARLRANKGRMTRASTSDIPESTVASDPAVTNAVYLRMKKELNEIHWWVAVSFFLGLCNWLIP